MGDIWGVLGIEPTTDRRTIKRAYAEAVKSCHPEEHPEEFKRLYEAYQAALDSLSAGSRARRDTPVGMLQSEIQQSEALHSKTIQAEIQQIETQQTETLHSKTVLTETQQIETQRSETLPPKIIQSETQPASAQEEASETARSGIQMVFARNDQQKQNAREKLTALWDAYLENRNRQNASALIQFMMGTEFACIRDLDDTMRMTMLMTKYMIAEGRAGCDDRVLQALCDIYAAEDTVSDGFDLAHLEDSAQRELSAMLRSERARRVQMREQKRGRIGSLLFNLALFGGLAVYIIVIMVQAWHGTMETRQANQCKETVAEMMEQEYPKLRFGDVLGKWEITDGDAENTYIITTEVRMRGSGGIQKGYIRVEAACDQDGNVTITDEKITGINVEE